MTKEEQIAALIVNGSSVYPRKLEAAAVATYVRMLSGYTVDEIDDAMMEAMKFAEDHFPTPAEIRSKASAARVEQIERKAREAGQVFLVEQPDLLSMQTDNPDYNRVLKAAKALFLNPSWFPRTMRGRIAAIYQAEMELGFQHPPGQDARPPELKEQCKLETILYRQQTLPNKHERLRLLQESQTRAQRYAESGEWELGGSAVDSVRLGPSVGTVAVLLTALEQT